MSCLRHVVGDDLDLSCAWLPPPGISAGLSGVQISAALYTPGGALVATPDCVVTSAAEGRFSIRQTAAQTAAWPGETLHLWVHLSGSGWRRTPPHAVVRLHRPGAHAAAH
jgi:hypothetical protein